MDEVDEYESRAERVARLASAAHNLKVAWTDAREQRDEAIDEGDAAGVPTRELARRAELAPITILRILSARETRRQQRQGPVSDPPA